MWRVWKLKMTLGCPFGKHANLFWTILKGDKKLRSWSKIDLKENQLPLMIYFKHFFSRFFPLWFGHCTSAISHKLFTVAWYSHTAHWCQTIFSVHKLICSGKILKLKCKMDFCNFNTKEYFFEPKCNFCISVCITSLSIRLIWEIRHRRKKHTPTSRF